MKATPGPMVSGRYFLPNAPLLWTKWIPACCVTSRNWMEEVSGAAFTRVLPINKNATPRTQRVASERFTHPPFLVAADAQRIGNAIDVVEPGRNQRDLQDAFVVETRGAQLFVIFGTAFRGVLGQLHDVIQHDTILLTDRR